MLFGCGRAPNGGGAVSGEGVSAVTAKANAQVAQAYDVADPKSIENAKRGFIARPTGKVLDATGAVIWDYDSFAFVDGKASDTVNPSLWRQALLDNQVGLFKVSDGIYQLRGFDLANITLIDGKTG